MVSTMAYEHYHGPEIDQGVDYVNQEVSVEVILMISYHYV